ncbi:MAG: phage tail tape measure protein [Oscillospiraceae bacterium]|nr:phage tail tape measure protein [Oscillospiraceae bacterium]
MAYDGTLKFDTSIDAKGFQKGIDTIGSIASKGIQATAAIMTGAAAAVGTMGMAAIKVGSDFESAMSTVEAISGAAGKELDALKEKAKEMGASTKFSATESAEAFEYMAMAGWKTEDMLSGIEGIMNLAAASGEELATTSDIVTDALTAFGMSAADSTHFADILAQASSNANTNVGMMGETFKYVAPVAGALGYTAEDTALAIGLMANSGIKASQAGTSLRSMMSRLTKPTKEVQSAMDTLGVSLTNSDGSMKSLNEIMGDLRDGFHGLSEAEAAELASSLAGQEAMSGLLAIVNASDEDFEKLESSIYNCDGAAARMAETMNNNLQGQITILKSGLEGLGISFYENLQEPLKGIAVEAQRMVERLQEAFDERGLEGLVTACGEVLAQIVERVASAAPDLINTAVNLVQSFCDSLKHSPNIGEAGASLIASLITGLLECADAIWTTAGVLAVKLAEGLSSKAPLILQQGIRLIVKLAEGIAKALPDLIPVATDCILTLAESFLDNLDLILDAALALALGLAEGLIRAIPIILERLPQIIIKICDALARFAPKLIQSGILLIQMLAKGLIEAIPQLISAHTDIASAILDGLDYISESIRNMAAEWLSPIVNSVSEWGRELLSTGSAAVSGFVNNAVTFFSELPGKISIWLTNTVSNVKAWGAEMLASAIETASNFLNNVITFISELPNKIAYWLGYATGTLIQWGIDLYNWVTTEIPVIIDNIVTYFSELPGKIWTWLVDTVNKTIQWGINLYNTATTWTVNTINAVVRFFSELPGKIWTWLVATVNKVVQWGSNLLSAAATAAQNAVNKVVEWFQQLPGKVWTWLSNTVSKVTQFASDLKSKASEAAQGFVTRLVDGVSGLPDKFREIGSNIVSGIWNGISSGWDWLVSKVKSLADSLFEGAKAALGIESPSKVFAQEVGQWIPPGIGVGIDNAMPALERQMDDEMDKLVKKMQTAVEIETGGITVKSRAKAEHDAAVEYPKGGDTYIDQHLEQENNYHVPVVTPSETAKANREAARKLLGGVK